jgi:YfiH family protein
MYPPPYITYPIFTGLPLQALTTTRSALPQTSGGSLSEKDILRLCRIVGVNPRRLTTAQQVHGGDTARVTSYAREVIPSTDALLTSLPGQAIAVFTADCVPGFLYDPLTPAVAIFHAGWRGTLLGIAQKTVQAMQEEFGSKPDKLIATLGPAISGENYPVSDEVGSTFIAGFGEGYPGITREKGGYELDLRTINVEQLAGCGVARASIYVNQQCTYAESDRYYSYRREGASAGRMMSVIWLDEREGDEC